MSLIDFTLEKMPTHEIMVMGIGGAGCNAVNHMFDMGVQGVTFLVCNTDKQALNNSNISLKVQLGEGLGAGNNPEKARKAATESLDKITDIFLAENTRMLFIAAGMGGGTGTGASPIIAKAAKALDILTVGIVSLPLHNEGPRRLNQAKRGMEELLESVDSLVIVHNDNISKIYGELPFDEAFAKADNILAYAARSISELVTRHDMVNVDLEDVRSVMLNSGLALMGSATAKGEDRIINLVNQTINSPLLNYKEIKGAKKILYNLSYGPDSHITMSEVTQILNLIQNQANGRTTKNQADIIWGAGEKTDLNDEIELTVIATGFSNMDHSTIISNNLDIAITEQEEAKPTTNSSIISTLIKKGEALMDKVFSVDEDINI